MIVKLKKDTNLKEYHLSNDKEYVCEVVIRKSGNWYRIKCDDGLTREFSNNHFISVEEIRDKKLNDLGI